MRVKICILMAGFLVVSNASFAKEETLSDYYGKAKEECHDLSCIRKEIDQINEGILRLLTKRTAYTRSG